MPDAAPDAVVLVALGVDGARHDGDLTDIAAATDTSVAYLQAGSPTLIEELDRLHAGGTERIELVGLSLGAPTARSWMLRVAGHWRRSHPDVEVVFSGRTVTGREAPLFSSAWENVPHHRHHVLVCRGPRCAARGAASTAAAFDQTLRQWGLDDDDVLVTMAGCLFPCNQAPVVVVHPDDTWYGGVDARMAVEIVDQHLVSGSAVEQARLPRSASSG